MNKLTDIQLKYNKVEPLHQIKGTDKHFYLMTHRIINK